MNEKKAALIILDGWGIGEEKESNAIASASTPVWDFIMDNYPSTILQASGEYVGLPKMQMGNSEVGHMTIGGGRVFQQDLLRINNYIKEFGFKNHRDLAEECSRVKNSGKAVHVIGLLSSGGVHSHVDHMMDMVKALDSFGVRIILHLFLDGRDVSPRSGYKYVEELLKKLPASVIIGSIGGRYYGMDRDKRWHRVEKAYSAIVHGRGAEIQDLLSYIQSSYEKGVTDEFIVPGVMFNYKGMEDGDAILCFNFRADRVQQLMTSLFQEEFQEFDRGKRVNFSFAYGMKSYGESLDNFMKSLFDVPYVENSLGQVLEAANLRQMRIAETEKYPHVTYFLNGGTDKSFNGEDRVLIPSPKVKTYDLKPDMSAAEVTDAFIQAVKENLYNLIVVNYANTDMVGHTGNLKAARYSVEIIDKCLGRICDVCQKSGVDLFITADHGNVEEMSQERENSPHTSHTCNPVPFVIIPAKRISDIKLAKGSLKDVSPTILDWIGLEIPKEMTGKSLLF